ncbi:HEXXH motif domain-containing protein [Amycolatopsis mongoliensis]|uniref:HEXXH motif domain-containing protein n=1 Tax=Amycolatopsis mongoliensis TaxID=715475 RepID=A0A9Y2NPW1_9PSEU|nr:HEXXH motif domain-containing protein [Amycolatopsis sp. 4-36]WIY06015.1 HEXXH motif domain-containing protein [Amycolatopsis sp. 4-36]
MVHTKNHVTSEPDLHSISWDVFDNLAAGTGGMSAGSVLRSADRSRRLLLLSGLVNLAEADGRVTGPLDSVETAWDLLVRAQETEPDALERVIAHPYTGSWAGYTTRLIEQGLTGECPLWVHYGYLHTLAAAAAIHAGLRFTIRVPVWNDIVVLPTLGAARLTEGGGFTTAEVHGMAGSFMISGDRSQAAPDTATWNPLREFRFESEGRVLALRLDDLDPHRGLYHPIPPDRLTEAEAANWRDLLGEAWRLIVEHLPEYAETLPAGLTSIVPNPAVPFRLPSASTGEAFGSAVIAGPEAEEPATLAAALVHEFQHIRLGGLLQLARLHDDDRTERLYAPWREDPRPLGGLVHGVYAFFGVSAFWRALSRAQPENRLAAFEFVHWRAQTWQTLEAIRDDAALTDAGRRFLNELAAVFGPWQSEPGAPEAVHWAEKLAADHYAGWRLRHVRPEPKATADLVRAWLRGEPCPQVAPGGRLDTVSDGEWANARADLIRIRLGQDGEIKLSQVWSQVPGALEGDHRLIAGSDEEARTAYRAVLGQDPEHAAALIGLGLSLPAGPAAHALLSVPELVRAVHRELRAARRSPAVDELAGWIGEAQA